MVSERRVRSGDPWPAGGTDTDVATLVDEARGGSQTAWDELVERYLPLVTSLMRRYRVTGADADDVNQTVWLRLVEHLDRIDDARALPGWLSTVTRHECFRIRRRGAGRCRRTRRPPPPSTDPTTPPTCSRSCWRPSGTPPSSTRCSSCPPNDATCSSCSSRTHP